MPGEFSTSVTGGDFAPDHTQRGYVPSSADDRLADRNVIIRSTDDYKSAFNDFFRQSIENYNSTQKRKDRKKGFDYYGDCEKDSKMGEIMHEFVLQIGNRDDNGIFTKDALEKGMDKLVKAENEQVRKGHLKPDQRTDLSGFLNNNPDRERLKVVLERIGRKLPERYPNLYFTAIVLHDDEISGTGHLQFECFGHATGYSQSGKAAGMQTRCSWTRALSDMGFHGEKDRTPIQQFQDDLKQFMQEEMEADGFSRKYMNNDKKHVKTAEFVEQQEEIVRNDAIIREQQQTISDQQQALLDLEKSEKAVEARLKGHTEIYELRCRGALEKVQRASDALLKTVDAGQSMDDDQTVLSYMRTHRFKGRDGKPKSTTIYDDMKGAADKWHEAQLKQANEAQVQAQIVQQLQPKIGRETSSQLDSVVEEAEKLSNSDYQYN